MKKLILNAAEQINILRFAQTPFHEPGNHLIVLAYHRVAEVDDPVSSHLYDLVCATPRQFDEQMMLLSTHYHPVSAEDVLDALNGGKPLPAQAVLVTVDDGYRDFKDTIFPIAQKHRIRPVLFVPTAFVGGGIFWWDRLFNALTHTNLQQLDTSLGRFYLNDKSSRLFAFDVLADYVRMQSFEKAQNEIEEICDRITPVNNQNVPYTLDWEELRAISAMGVTIASHTHSHPILTHIPTQNVRKEIRVSQDLIRQQIGEPLPIFAYPDGRDHAVSKELGLLVKNEGVQIAFTMSDRISHIHHDNHHLFPRLIPYYSISRAQFHLKLTALRSSKDISLRNSE